MTTLRSHTAKEILDAYTRGETICVLDTGTHGQDDVLIGSLEDCRQDVIDNEGRDVFADDGWTLSEIGGGDEPLRTIIEDGIEILNCYIDDGLDEPRLIVQIFESDDEDDRDSVGVGGDSLDVENDDVDGDYTIYDVVSDPSSFVVKGDEGAGYWISHRTEQS